MPAIALLVPPDRLPGLFDADSLAALDRLGAVHRWSGDAAALPAALAGCRTAIGTWGVAPDAALAAACPELRLWVHAAGSVKGIIRALGPHAGRVQVASCAAAIADSVAEYTHGLLLMGLNAIPWRQRIFAGAGRPEDFPLPQARGLGCRRRLRTATVGIIGASQVGRRVAARLRGWCARIAIYYPYLPDAEAAAMGAERWTDLRAMCAACDAITIHTPDLPATRRLVDAACLSALPDGALVVNTSRPGCLDEEALERELVRGRLSALLDVTSAEEGGPFPRHAALRGSPHCLVTPHDAGGASTAIGAQAVRAVAQHLAGQPAEGLVDPARLELLA